MRARSGKTTPLFCSCRAGDGPSQTGVPSIVGRDPEQGRKCTSILPRPRCFSVPGGGREDLHSFWPPGTVGALWTWILAGFLWSQDLATGGPGLPERELSGRGFYNSNVDGNLRLLKEIRFLARYSLGEQRTCARMGGPASRSGLPGSRLLTRAATPSLSLSQKVTQATALDSGPGGSRRPGEAGRPWSPCLMSFSVPTHPASSPSPDGQDARQPRSRNPSTWTVEDVVWFVKDADPQALGPHVELFRKHVGTWWAWPGSGGGGWGAGGRVGKGLRVREPSKLSAGAPLTGGQVEPQASPSRATA